MSRSWDIELYNDPAVVEQKLNEGPQLCQVFSKSISPQTLFNVANRFYCYQALLNGEPRSVVLLGAYKGKGDCGEDISGVREIFGKDASEYANIDIFDDLIHIDGIPYLPFCKDVEMDTISKMGNVYDIQVVNERYCVLCMYYDHNMESENSEGGIISQFQV